MIFAVVVEFHEGTFVQGYFRAFAIQPDKISVQSTVNQRKADDSVYRQFDIVTVPNQFKRVIQRGAGFEIVRLQVFKLVVLLDIFRLFSPTTNLNEPLHRIQ